MDHSPDARIDGHIWLEATSEPCQTAESVAKKDLAFLEDLLLGMQLDLSFTHQDSQQSESGALPAMQPAGHLPTTWQVLLLHTQGTVFSSRKTKLLNWIVCNAE